MAILDSRSVPPSRIESTVERELARRRRLLRLYLLLLLVPLGLAAWFLLAGRSDQDLFRRTVEERVAPVEERYRQIAPKLDQVETLDQVLPVVARAAEQLQAQQREVKTLRQQVREITPVVQEIRDNQASLVRGAGSAGEVKELAARLAAMEKDLQGYQQLSAQLVRQEERLAGIERQQRQVAIDLKEVAAKVEKQPAAPGFSLLDLQKLNERVRVLEQGTGDLKKDLFKLQADVKDQPPPG
jgi:chromosome segregation ATPase